MVGSLILVGPFQEMILSLCIYSRKVDMFGDVVKTHKTGPTIAEKSLGKS